MSDKEKDKASRRPFMLNASVTTAGDAVKKDSLKVSQAQHPAPQTTLFDLGVTMEISGKGDLASSVVVHPVERSALKGIDPATVRFFRFDARAAAWRPVWNSGLNQELGYAWAKVREPGTYVLSGLPRDGVLR